MYITNLTAEEHYRLHGTLRESDIEHVLQREAAFGDLDGLDDMIQEGIVSYPDEDFLADIIHGARTLAKRLRGADRTSFLAVVESMEALQQTTYHSTEYGIEELRKAKKAYQDARP